MLRGSIFRSIFKGFMNQTLITLVWLLLVAVVGNAYAQHCYSSQGSQSPSRECVYFADDECQQYRVPYNPTVDCLGKYLSGLDCPLFATLGSRTTSSHPNVNDVNTLQIIVWPDGLIQG
jgi:hypothetical protein